MSFPSVNAVSTKSFKGLKKQYAHLKKKSLAGLFEEDARRFNKYSIRHQGILFDYSKNFIDAESKSLLLQLLRECKMKAAMKDFLSGKPINKTENRAVMHMALRSFGKLDISSSFTSEAQAARDKMKRFCKSVHQGEIFGYTNKRFKYVVNIGIGGSDLGPAMMCEALKAYQDKDIKPYFVSNVDGSQLVEVLGKINLEETLFLVASKTFTTQETMANARRAREYAIDYFQTEEAIAKHFAAISVNQEEVEKFGIAHDNQFVFWDWVGGRFSLWGSIGLSIALAVGYDRFEKILEGAEDIDDHFFHTPMEKNIPIWMALIGFVYTQFFEAHTEAILPYAQYLHMFPDYLQQACMESNGKNVDRNGKKIAYSTSPVVWGAPGTNGQHAFYQLIHQGTHFIPIDFIAFAEIPRSYEDQHDMLVANCIAQAEALMKGKTRKKVEMEMKKQGCDAAMIKEIAPYRVFEGNKPSNMIFIDKLTPYTLGQLTALYEHKIFAQGVLWNVFSFDQWGVELGKKLANDILREITDGKINDAHDSSTQALIKYFLNN